MAFKLVSKNNMGLVTALILVILLCQSKFFNFLIDTYLGRIVLLAFVILIAHTHKILGLFAVLCIIIAFNNNSVNYVYSYNYYEGFDVSGNVLNGNIQAAIKSKLQTVQQDVSGNVTNADTSSSTSTSTSTSNTESFKGREGFCMTDRESNMLRGKQSNAIPVFNSREQSDDVNPSDNSDFKNNYASF